MIEVIKKRFSSILLVLFLVSFVWYFVTNFESFKPLSRVSILTLLLLTLIKIGSHLVNGYFLKLSLEVFTRKLKFLEAIYIAILSAIGNFFGPLLGGATIRAVYLKKVHKLPYSYFTSTLGGYYAILFAANSLLAIVSLAFLRNSSKNTGLLLFFTAWLVFMVGLMFIRLPSKEIFAKIRTRRFNFFVRAIYEVEDGWRRLLRSKGLLLKLSLLTVIVFAITIVTAAVEFNAVGVSISLAALGLYTAVSTSSILVSLTPGAIGIRESLLLLTSSVMGVSNAQILQVSVIDRGISFFLLIGLYILTRFIKPKIGSEKTS